MDWPVKHLSNSSIKTYLECPFRFKAKYILKVKQPSNEHFALGNAVHGAGEFQVRFKMKHGKNLPLSAVLEAYQRKATEAAEALNKPAKDAFRQMYLAGHELAEQLYFYYIDHPPVAVEQYFKVDMGYELPILGFIDAIFEDHEVIDLKTCNKPWPKSKLNDTPQLTIYNEAYYIMHGVYPKKLGIIELNKKMAVEDKTRAITRRLTTRGANDREKLDIMVNKVIEGMRAGKYPRCGSTGRFGCWACSEM